MTKSPEMTDYLQKIDAILVSIKKEKFSAKVKKALLSVFEDMKKLVLAREEATRKFEADDSEENAEAYLRLYANGMKEFEKIFQRLAKILPEEEMMQFEQALFPTKTAMGASLNFLLKGDIDRAEHFRKIASQKAQDAMVRSEVEFKRTKRRRK